MGDEHRTIAAFLTWCEANDIKIALYMRDEETGNVNDCQLYEGDPDVLIRHYFWKRDRPGEAPPEQLSLM